MARDIKVTVRRQDADPGSKPRWQSYDVEVDDNAVVLDALLKIREDVDGSLTFRCSCRAAICGSCAMRVDGQAHLACKTPLREVEHNGEIVVEPMGNLPVIKDLVVDMTPFWSKVTAVQPWLKGRPRTEEEDREYLVSNDSMLHQAEMMNCIMCGACVSDCTVLEVDPSFLGPAALAKAYRFVSDPRDGDTDERLRQYSEPTGIWDCTHCFMCVEVCPKDVKPMERIMAIRGEAVKAGYTNSGGARHLNSFAESVEHSGGLDETKLAVDSLGWFNILGLLQLAPVGIRALLKNKMPMGFFLHKKRPGAQHIKRIFEKMEGK